jgi:hypothetical protein
MTRMALAIVAAVVLATTAARADPPEDEPSSSDAPRGPEHTEPAFESTVEPSESDPEREPIDQPPDVPRREVPDYDGRPDPGPDAGEVAIWIPRILFWPVYAVLEYFVRRPVGYIVTVGEREQWGALQLPPFGSASSTWGIVPTVLVDFGFQPSGGIYAWIDGAFARGNDLRLQASFGGPQWLRGMVLDRIHVGPAADVELIAIAASRPDLVFTGLGPDADPDRVARYGRRWLEASARATARPWRASRVRWSVGARASEFFDTEFRLGGERSMSDAVAQGWFPLPPGFATGYGALWQRLDAAFDTRERESAGQSGIRLEGHATLGFDPAAPIARRWLQYGGVAGAFWEIAGRRTLGLWSEVQLTVPLGDEPIPFTELPDLAGRGRLTGFRAGWITGESAVAMTIEYRYPIWVALDGVIGVAVGNAFGRDLEGFGVEHLRTSYMLGLRTVGDPDQSFTMQIGLGTDTFARGLEPVSVRLTAGMQEGF